MCALCLSSTFPLCNPKYSEWHPPHVPPWALVSWSELWVPSDGPQLSALWSPEVCRPLESQATWEEGRRKTSVWFFTQASTTKESGRIVSASKLKSRVELWGYLGLFCFLKNKVFLRPTEKELHSSLSLSSWGQNLGISIWLVNADWAPAVCRVTTLRLLSTSLGNKYSFFLPRELLISWGNPGQA